MELQEIQQKVEFLSETARAFEQYYQDEEALFEAINALDEGLVNTLLTHYYHFTDWQSKPQYFAPVNLLRHKILLNLKDGILVDKQLVEEIKEKFLSRDLTYFAELPESVQNSIQNYQIGKRGPFHAWSNDFRLLYTLLFLPELKDKVNRYLEEIKRYVLETLHLNDFDAHYVNFNGEQAFGATSCWMAFYPRYKVAHTNAFQLFLRIKGNGVHYGIIIGSDLKRKIEGNIDVTLDDLMVSQDFQDVINGFQMLKEKVLTENQKIKQVWKYAPGENAKYWDEMKDDGVMAIGWDELGDLTRYETTEDLADALGVESASNQTWNLELFQKASIGDIVIANRGRSVAVGIGVITGEYEHRASREYYKNVRAVKWLITQEVQFEKTIFRPDTFSPTRKFPEIKAAYIQQYPELQDKFEELEWEKTVERDEKQDDRPEDRKYYWLNANPKIWNFYDLSVGDTHTYTARNSKGNKRRIYQYFLDVNPGDVMIGYLTSPIKQIAAMLEATKSLYTDDLEGEVIEFQLIEFLEHPVDFTLLKENPDLQDAEPIINNQGSLFKLSDEQFEIIQNVIEEVSPPPPPSQPVENDLQDVLEKTGLSQIQFERIIETVKQKKQIVFQGAPGTGKTYLAQIVARYLAKDENNVEIIQFHPSYSYEDFVEGYRPSEKGGLVLKSGIFKELCRKALTQPDKNYVLIIDEINRGDISKIFGELLYLLEYREQKIRLTYSPEIDFRIPHNIYILGTMNLADRSLALIDYALRRRFRFITLETDYELIKECNKDSELHLETIIENIREVNHHITSNHALGKDFQIGHSYFLHRMKDRNTLQNVWDYEIEPLLLEYFFDNREKVQQLHDIFFNNVPD